MAHQPDEERSTRSFIQAVLLDYAYTYLTRDHVEGTADEVSTILAQCLQPVPHHDSSALVLLRDPMKELLCQICDEVPGGFHERWPVDLETLAYLRSESKVSTSALDKPHLQEDFDMPSFELWSSVLSARALRETPVFVRPSVKKSIFYKQAVHPLSLGPVARNDATDRETISEDVLYSRIAISQELRKGIMRLTASLPITDSTVSIPSDSHQIPAMCRSSPSQSPVLAPGKTRLLSPPIFCKDVSHTPTNRHWSSVLPEISAELVEEFDEPNWMFLDGWQTFPEPSNSSSSSAHSSLASSELDELSRGHTPFTSPVIVPITLSKMDEVLLLEPRVRPDNSIATAHVEAEPKFVGNAIPADLAKIPVNSFPTNAVNGNSNEYISDLLQPCLAIKALCRAIEGTDPMDIILEETLVGSDSLLPVPRLPDPTSFVGQRGADTLLAICGGLESTVPCQLLGLELNWRPFNFGENLPSLEALCGTILEPADMTELRASTVHAADLDLTSVCSMYGSLETPVTCMACQNSVHDEKLLLARLERTWHRPPQHEQPLASHTGSGVVASHADPSPFSTTSAPPATLLTDSTSCDLRKESTSSELCASAPSSSHMDHLQTFLSLRSTCLADTTALPSWTTSQESYAPPQAKRTSVPLSIPNLFQEISFRDLMIPTTSAKLRIALASMAFLTRRLIARSLEEAGLMLLERETLQGAHVVLNREMAVLFQSLSLLPANVRGLSQLLADLSPRFRRISVVLEAYSPVSGVPSDCIFSDAICEAFRTLRVLSIPRQNGMATATIAFHLAMNPSESGKFTRYLAEQYTSRSHPIQENEDEDERVLANTPGMNHYASAMILANMSLDELMDLTVDERLSRLSVLVGPEQAHLINLCIQAGSGTDPDEDML